VFLVTDFTGNGLKFHVPLLKSRVFFSEGKARIFAPDIKKISVLKIGQNHELNFKKFLKAMITD
jgi:hypothetical protein